MDFFAKILELFDLKMKTPTLFGWFHVLWLLITAATAVLLCVTHKKDDTEHAKRVVIATTVTVILFEIYKQINYSFSYSDGIKFDYQWYAFPFQFCSMPMYIGALTAVFRKGKIHKSLMAFLATYAVFAGICVMIYPNDVFIDIIGINIQTMICHGSMIALGVYLFVSGTVELSHKTFLRAFPVFACCICVAMILNEIAYASGLLARETFNMFFISPHCEGTLPVYSLVQRVVPFPFCVIIYFAIFSLAAYVILLAAMGISKLKKTLKNKNTGECPVS